MGSKFAAIAIVACLTGTPALAVVTPFGGAATGSDPLGNNWVAAGDHWGQPGYLAGDEMFNSAMVANNSGDYATSLSFTFLKGVAGTIDQTPSFTPFGSGPETRFTNLTDGVAWLVSYSNGNVTFTAPNMAARLDPSDHFFVNVKFTGMVDPQRFSFAGLWDDAPAGVPELGTWASMTAGFGLLGLALRSRHHARQSLA